MKENLIKQIIDERLIVIIRGVQRDKLIPLCKALYSGGVRFVEVTYNFFSDEETAENIRLIKEHFGDRFHVGAGTVLTPEQVKLTKDVGGEYIISPNTDLNVIKTTNELCLASMPAAFTPSEIVTAWNAGADFVKLFPASALGANYIKAVLTPLKHIRLLAVGGIGAENAPKYIKAGAKGVGIGGDIIRKGMLENSDYDGIRKLAEEYISALNR